MKNSYGLAAEAIRDCVGTNVTDIILSQRVTLLRGCQK